MRVLKQNQVNYRLSGQKKTPGHRGCQLHLQLIAKLESWTTDYVCNIWGFASLFNSNTQSWALSLSGYDKLRAPIWAWLNSAAGLSWTEHCSYRLFNTEANSTGTNRTVIESSVQEQPQSVSSSRGCAAQRPTEKHVQRANNNPQTALCSLSAWFCESTETQAERRLTVLAERLQTLIHSRIQELISSFIAMWME